MTHGMRELIPDAGLVRLRPSRRETETADFVLCGHRQLMGLLLELDQHLIFRLSGSFGGGALNQSRAVRAG
jgi:hypothetical protein